MNSKNNTVITFDDICQSEEIRTYIIRADKSLERMGLTKHGFSHVTKVAHSASSLLESLGYDAHVIELTRIAGYMHDIGNVINRVGHAQSGAMMAFRILDKMGMPYDDVAKIVAAIGNHDDSTAWPVNEVAAAIIVADKCDVRRSRVRLPFDKSDIHDRVNYAVTHNETALDLETKTFTLILKIDSEISSVMEYFEIFLERMKLCKHAASYLGLTFCLEIDGLRLC